MSKRFLHAAFLLVCLLLAPMSQAAVVNINKADAAALVENLEGIGPKKAAAIVSYRRKNGSFKSLDELLNIKGIGEKTLKKNKGQLSLSKGAVKAISKVKKAASSAKKKSSTAKPAKKTKTSTGSSKDKKKKTKAKK